MARLEKVAEGGWDALRALDMDEWLWLDMESPGLHNANALPATPPSQVSHVWGWSAAALVRARVDRDLPGRVAGAVLHLAEDGTGEQVDVSTAEVRRWTEGDGRVRVSYPASLKDRARGVTLYRVTRLATTTGGVSMMPLEFVRLDSQ